MKNKIILIGLVGLLLGSLAILHACGNSSSSSSAPPIYGRASK